MSDYLGHLAQRASATTRQVMPRVGALFEPMFGAIRVPTAFARDEVTEGSEEQTPPQLTAMDDRLQELHSTLNATTVQPAFVADSLPGAHQGSRPFPPAQTRAPMVPSQSDVPMRQNPSQARSPGLLVVPHAPPVRPELREPGTVQMATETRESREGLLSSTPRSIAVRAAVAAMDRSQPEQPSRTVRIEIGRIEIRATSSPTRTYTTRPAARPRQSLEDYLQQQSRRTR